MKRLISYALGIILTVSVLTTSDAPARAKVGDKLHHLSEEPIMKFFGLTNPDSILRGKNLSKVTLRPDGDYLGSMVEMALRLGPDGEVQVMSITMDRAFLDKEEWVRARGIALDFLAAAVPEGDEAKIRDLKNQIEYPQDKGVNYTFTLPEMPSEATAAYEVFNGQRTAQEEKFQSSILRLENVKSGKRQLLRMTVVGLDPSQAPITTLMSNR